MYQILCYPTTIGYIISVGLILGLAPLVIEDQDNLYAFNLT